MARILVTGGAGFIGSSFVRMMLSKGHDVVNLDKLTYAGNLENLKDVENSPNYKFIKGDICDEKLVDDVVKEVEIIVNFAAETHVDRSIGDPDSFIKTDILGTHTLLEAARRHGIKKFVHVGTDECYGSIDHGSFTERDVLSPSSPYSASKAGADMLCISYYKTYGLPVVITRSSNNYGPYQYPEKLIPVMITNAIDNLELPVYGDGQQVRDWLYVEDNCRAIGLVMEKGKPGEIYNISGGNEKTNLEVIYSILNLLDKPKSLIKFVKDRPGHDRRYSIDDTKLRKLGFRPRYSFEKGIENTVLWYKDNEQWWRKLKSGEYLEYYKRHYVERHGLRKKKMLVIGVTSFSGKKIMSKLKEKYELVGTYLSEGKNDYVHLDITNEEEVKTIFSKVRPDYVVLVSAFSNVDACEVEKDRATMINVDGVKHVADACVKFGSKLIYFSTDYVFDGKKGDYKETDIPNPLSHYAKTKLEGEKIVLNIPNSIILRVVFLYGFNSNDDKDVFMIKVIKSLSRGEKINAFTDQYGTPTFIDDIPIAIDRLIQNHSTGIYHVAGPDKVSRFEFAQRIAEVFGFDKNLINPMVLKDVNLKARRPRDSSLNISKLRNEGIKTTPLVEALKKVREQFQEKVIK